MSQNSHEGLWLCNCPECGQRFVEYWWEVIDWGHGDDKVRRYWMQVNNKEAQAATLDDVWIREIARSRPRLLRDEYGYCWQDADATFGPDILPPG